MTRSQSQIDGQEMGFGRECKAQSTLFPDNQAICSIEKLTVIEMHQMDTERIILLSDVLNWFNLLLSFLKVWYFIEVPM